MELIVTCGCGDTDAFAKDAFRLIFSQKTIPPIKTVEGMVEPTSWDSRSRRELEALKKNKEKFAYYITDEEIWDLLKGVRIA